MKAGLAAHDEYLATPRFPSLDGLRCFAIIPVFWHHCTTGPLPGALGRGPLGVDLFFAISGFLITTLLLRERDATGRISARGFYARRALRIFPLYYAVLGLYVLHAWLGMPEGAQRDHFWKSLPFFASYTTNWFVDFSVPHPVSFAFAWSLATEEQFYLLWPWVLRGRSRWLWPVLATLALLALHQGVLYGHWLGVLPASGLARRMALSIASPILMGALLGLVLHGARGFAALRLVLGRGVSCLVLFGALVLSAYLDGVPLWLAQLLMTLVVGACAIRGDHSLTWLTDPKAIRWVGTVSYGIYLFHVAIITFARRVLPSPLGEPAWVFVIAFPVAVLLASLSFVAFEEPVLRLRQRFRPFRQSALSVQPSRPASFAR
jgi:peptidoglycan/LPS O-acetylase OafA/YrhL